MSEWNASGLEVDHSERTDFSLLPLTSETCSLWAKERSCTQQGRANMLSGTQFALKKHEEYVAKMELAVKNAIQACEHGSPENAATILRELQCR